MKIINVIHNKLKSIKQFIYLILALFFLMSNLVYGGDELNKVYAEIEKQHKNFIKETTQIRKQFNSLSSDDSPEAMTIDMAIEEMDRCVNELKFPGIEIGSNVNGKNLSEEVFYSIFKHAEKIGCSIFVHPWEMMGQSDMKKYWLPWLVGMPAETSRAICSIIFGGILDRYPALKIAFAHGGGAFPFTIGRIEHGFNVRPDLCAIDNERLPSSYLEHIYVDSLVHDEKTMSFLIDTLGENQIALGSDYPFPLGEHHPGKLIEGMDLPDSTKQRLLAGTALEWLGLDESEFTGN